MPRHAHRLLCLTALLAGCTQASPPEGGADGGRVAAAPARIVVDDAALPARYAAALPVTSAALRDWHAGRDDDVAPPQHVVDNLLLGREAWFARLRTAAAAVPPDDAAAWAAQWRARLVFETPAPAFCTLSRPTMAAPPSTLRLALAAVFVESCAVADDLALVLRADTPDDAVLAFWRGDRDKVPYHPRLADAVAATIARGDDFAARRAAFTLVASGDPRAVAALLKIHAGIDDEDRADAVALAFFDTTDRDALARAEAACGRRPHEPMCDRAARAEQAALLAAFGAEEAPDPSAAERAAVDARIDQLAAMGFPRVASMDRTQVDTDDARAILTSAGTAHWFDVETGLFPNRHDSLARTLAALASPALDDVVFEEVPPTMDERTGEESGPYALTAYVDGRRLRLDAENHGDWYDVDAVVRLLNAVAAQREVDVRYATLATDDQMAVVVAAPPAALRAGVDAGVIAPGDATDAERIGKGFEAEVLRGLRN